MVIVLSGIGLLALISVLINVTAVQNFVVRRITNTLSERLHTEVSIQHVDFTLFNKFTLDGTYIADQHKDTLLYAGKLTLNVTNFFFLKKKTWYHYVLQTKTWLHYIGLQNATLNLRRLPGDSVWNYQFILDALSSPSSSGGGQMPSIDIKKVNITHIRVNKTDAWTGQDMLISADHILINARNIDLRKRRIIISNVSLAHPLFVLENYTPSKPAGDTTNSSAPPLQNGGNKNDSLQWNTDHWILHVAHVSLQNGGFALIDKNEARVEPYFDPTHMAFYDINASLNNINLVKDSIITQIKLSAKERCGLNVKNLACRFKISPVEMEFSHLDLTTNHSHLTDYFSMSYPGFSDLNNFIHDVYLRGNFKNSEVSSDDIAYFAPPLKTWNTDINVSGNAYGTIANLTADNMHIRAGKATELIGKIRMRGLPDIENTFIDFQAQKLSSTGNDLIQFFPDLKKQSVIDMNNLTAVSFAGNYTGFIEDFVAYGDFKTNLGNVHTDLNMKFGKQYKAPQYSGKLSSQNFNLGKLLNNSLLGPVSLSAKIDGSGFNLKDINAKVDGKIDSIYLNGYTYHYIKTEGTLNKKLFNGSVEVADSNLNLNFAGAIDFNNKLPVFHFKSDITKSDLLALNLTKDSITFSGKLDLDLTGNSIDNFLGDARLYDINLFKNKIRIAFDTLVVHSRMDSSGGKMLTLQGNEIKGFMRGNYDLDGLKDASQSFLNRYFPNKFPPPSNKKFYENFTFGFQLGDADKIISAFIPQFTGLDNSAISGGMNTYQDTLMLKIAIPAIGYSRYRFNNVRINVSGKFTGLGMQTDIGEIFVQDSLLIPGAEISATAFNDTSFIRLKTFAASQALNNADLYARVTTLTNGYNIRILNSELMVNDKTWNITPDNEITLEKNKVIVNNFNISHNEQRITLTSNNASLDSASFLIKLQGLYIGDFSQFFTTNPQLEGIANGTIQIDDPLGNMIATAKIDASRFRINNDSMGVVHVGVSYQKENQLLHWNVFKNDNPVQNFALSGMAGLGKKDQVLHGDFKLNHTDISVLNNFIGNYVTNFKGFATGALTLSGTTSMPEVTGVVRLDSVGLRVNYLGTYYTLNNETINFTPTSINLGTITLHDVDGHNAALQGTITHKSFSDLHFNLNLNTQNFKLLHTTALDNPLYYGEAYASGRVNLTGPLSDMKMTLNISPQKGTHIFLPLSDSKDIGKHDFVIFKQYGTEQRAVRPAINKVNLNVKLYANMNPNAKIDVIVDAASGDRISATGTGSLQMNIDLNGNFRMYGNYTIENGDYIFSFKGLLSRTFIINQGSTIAWNGDPSNANVSIAAIYNVPGGASLYDLVAGQNETSGALTTQDAKLLRQREKTDVYLFLKGSLMHPDISYDIRLPDVGISTGSIAMTQLQQIRQNPNDLINQVAALLAFGQFIPPTSGSNNAFLSGGLSSAGQWVSSQLSGVLNNLLGNTFKKLGVNFNMNYSSYSANGGSNGVLQRNDVQFNLSKNIFNNRVHIEAGPSLDWGRGNTPQATSNSYFAGDFRFEYLITPDGRFRFVAFSQSNYDVLLNQNLTRGGIGLSYSREFNRLHDLFLTKEEKQRRDSLRRSFINRYIKENTNDSLPPSDTTKVIPPILKDSSESDQVEEQK